MNKSRDRPLTLDEILHRADMMGADIEHLERIRILQRIALQENITTVDDLYNFVMAMSASDLAKYQIKKENNHETSTESSKIEEGK